MKSNKFLNYSLIFIALGLFIFLGLSISFPSLFSKKDDSVFVQTREKDPDVLEINQYDLEQAKKEINENVDYIANKLTELLLKHKKDINKRTCSDKLFALDKNSNFYSLNFLDNYKLGLLGPKNLVIRYNICSILWYKNIELVLMLTTKELLNNDVQDVGIKKVPAFVYRYSIVVNNKNNNYKIKLIEKNFGLVDTNYFF